MEVPDSVFQDSGCLACGLDAKNEIHDFNNVWFHHRFSRGDVEKFLVQKMADQIAKEVDNKILDDVFYAFRPEPFKLFAKWKPHPLSYMVDITDCQNESVELRPKEKSILPDRFVCVSFGPKDYDDLWDPHPFGLEDEPNHQTDLRSIRYRENWNAEQKKKKERMAKLPWFIKILSR